jgi:hypothetical protein
MAKSRAKCTSLGPFFPNLILCVCLETLKAVAFPNSTSSLDVPSSNTLRTYVDSVRHVSASGITTPTAVQVLK